jgi:hypothetical protein
VAVPVGAGVGRVVQQVLKRRPVRPPPLESAAVRAVVRPDRDADPVVDQVTEQAVQGRLPVELIEDQPHRRLDLLVGVDGPLARSEPDVADRGHAQEVAAAGLVELALIHAFLDNMKSCFAHHAVQAEQEPVVVVGRVVDRVGVGQEHAEPGTELEQLVPVPVRPGQTAHLQAEDPPDVVECDLGQEPLEPGPSLDRLAALAQVVVDRRHPVPRPSEGDGAVGQGVLAGGGLVVFDHLLGRGLADVDEGRAVEVPGPELGRPEGVIHGRPPRRGWPPGAVRGVGRAGRGVAAVARPGVGSRPSA